METLYRGLLILFLSSGSALFIAILVWMVLGGRCKKRFHVAILFEDTDMSDTSINVGSTDVATAVIVDNTGAPVAGAVFDAAPSWTLSSATVASFTVVDDMHVDVTALAVGTSNLDVVGAYLGNTITGQAVVTVTAVAGGFAVNITWAAQAPAPAPKRA